MEVAILVIIALVVVIVIGACAYTGSDPFTLTVMIIVVGFGIAMGVLGARAWTRRAIENEKAAVKAVVAAGTEQAKEVTPSPAPVAPVKRVGPPVVALTDEQKQQALAEFLAKINQ